MMKTYLENIRRFKQFYASDYYQCLKENDAEFISSVLEYLSLDPDAVDETLYQKLGEKYNFTIRKKYLIDDGIRLSSDVICGRKQMYRLFAGNPEKWISAYEKIRGNLHFHFLWPQHKAPTINTLRYAVFLDRIDYTLFDLKNYFEGKTCLLQNAYQQENTKKWLSKFNDFKHFIDKMQLNAFVDENYEVYNIETMNQEKIQSYISLKEIRDNIHVYLHNILKLK